MKEKLEYLMNHTGLRVGEIADKLGVKTPVISHLLKGRNKPNFILTGKIIATFTDFSPLWWLGLSDDPFATDSSTPTPKKSSSPESASDIAPLNPTHQSESPTILDSIETLTSQSSTRPRSDIERVIIFYKDYSFETFTPKK